MVRDRSVSSCQTWRAQRKRHGLRYRPYTRARELLLTRHLGERMWPGGSTSATPRLPPPCARSNCASSYARRAWSRTSDAPDLARATRLRSLMARSGEHPANYPDGRVARRAWPRTSTFARTRRPPQTLDRAVARRVPGGADMRVHELQLARDRVVHTVCCTVHGTNLTGRPRPAATEFVGTQQIRLPRLSRCVGRLDFAAQEFWCATSVQRSSEVCAVMSAPRRRTSSTSKITVKQRSTVASAGPNRASERW